MSCISAYFHCVFSDRKRVAQVTPELVGRRWIIIGGIARQNKMKAIEIGGMEDHVHEIKVGPRRKLSGRSTKSFVPKGHHDNSPAFQRRGTISALHKSRRDG